MSLQPGAIAPAFQAADLWGNVVALSDYAGKPLLLSFLRNSACALCNLRVHQLIQRYPLYHEQGLEIVAVFESPAESMREYVGRQDAPFTLLSDPEALLYDRYGLESSEEKIAATMAREETKEQIAAAAAAGFQLTREAGSNFLRMPADFLIDPDGMIRHARYAQYVTDHLPFATIEAFLTEYAQARAVPLPA